MRHMARATDRNHYSDSAYRHIVPSLHPIGSRVAVTVATASTAPELSTPIQCRPLQANPSHPLLWNYSTTGNGAGGSQVSLSRQRHSGSTAGTAVSVINDPLSSSASTLSTLSSSLAVAFPSGDRRDSRPVATHDGCVESSHLSSSTTAHVVRPHRRSQSRIPPSSSSASALADPAIADLGGAGASQVKTGRERKVTAVNYNALLQQELQRQESHDPAMETLPKLSSSPGFATGGVPPAQSPFNDRAVVHDAEARSSLWLGETATLPPCVTTTSVVTATVEGPLPPEVRRIIAQSCSGGSSDTETNALVDAAEKQARRLISTGRRVKVYREELTAAEEERRDLSSAVEERRIVRSALQSEVDDINARIAALLQERELVETQLNTQDEAAARDERKLVEAQDRVKVLRNAIDGIVEDTVVARMMLRQQVPSLHIENYY